MTTDQITQILHLIEQGESTAAGELIPLVYAELRKLARSRMRQERDGHTLAPTALVHEAYLRLVDQRQPVRWESRGHFFAAAAEAMRRILIEHSRSRMAQKRGGNVEHVSLPELIPHRAASPEQLLAFDESLQRLAEADPLKAELVKLRCFAGLDREALSNVLGISLATVDRYWTYAQAKIYSEIIDRVEE